MLIAHSNLSLSARHEQTEVRRQETVLTEAPRAGTAFAKLLERELVAPPAQLLAPENTAATPADTPATPPEETPLKTLLELLFGQAPTAASPPVSNGASSPHAVPPRGLRVMTLAHVGATESCAFAARGNVCLADGTQRQFEVDYRLERSEESTQAALGTNFRDPLVIDFGAPGATLGARGVEFDLDGDGTTENMRMPGGASAVLFIDRNHNDVADDGGELFGPTSGDGFAELGRLDDDGNGWIDSGDAAYADLKLWQVDAGGANHVRGLAAAEVGALATEHADTPFTIKENGANVGQMRSSSVWLGEHGGAGVVRQIDIATTPRDAPAA